MAGHPQPTSNQSAGGEKLIRKFPLASSVVQLKHWFKGKRRLILSAGGVAGVVIGLRMLGLLQSWELAIYDQMLKLRSRPGLEDKIIIVAIEEEDIQEIRQWPLSGEVMAELLTEIKAGDPRVIGLDIYRDLPIEPGEARLQSIFASTPNLIGIEKLRQEGSDNSATAPPPILAENDQVGFNNVLPDPDGKVRRNILYLHEDGESHTSFAFKVAVRYLAVEEIIPRAAQSNPNYLQVGERVFPFLEENDGGYVNMDDRGYQILADFRSTQSFQRVTLSQVLAGEVPETMWRDKIVVIGSTAPSLQDFFYVPYHLDSFNALSLIAGVELHANFISQILNSVLLNQTLIKTLPDWVEGGWIILWSGAGAVILWSWRSPLKATLGLVVSIGVIGVTASLAFQAGWWIPTVPPIVGLSGAAIVVMAYIAHQEEELQRSQEFLQSIIDKIPDPVFVKDEQRRLLILNEAYCQLIGYPLENLLGQSEADFLLPHEAEVFQTQEEQVFANRLSLESEDKLTDFDGNLHYLATKRSLHQDAANNTFLVGVIHDITERKQIEERLRRTTRELTQSNEKLKSSESRLRYLAYHDDLTGLANRQLFLENLEEMLNWAQENQKLVGLLFLDLNGFKQVNDSWGHDVGDLLLKAVAKRLTNCLRGSDVICRLGGDEFTVILPGIKKAEDLGIVSTKLQKTLSQPFMLENYSITVSASIGSSFYPQDGATKEVLIKKADSEMFKVKEQTKAPR